MNFELGSVVLPAEDGLLAEHGYDVKEIGALALGVVIEVGSRRSHVHFPALRVSLWLDHLELRDIDDELQINPAFAPLGAYREARGAERLLVFVIAELICTLKATQVLGIDHGKLSDVWEEAAARLPEYFSGNPSIEVTRLSVGIEEFRPEAWEAYRAQLGARLVLARFLPSGMHKFELSIYLRPA